MSRLNTWINTYHHHVPSSHEQLLVTSNIIFLHFSLFFTSLPRCKSVSPVGSVTPSIHHWCGLPITHCPSHLTSMRLFSRLPSFLIMWPKYLSLCLTIAASRELSGQIFCTIDLFVSFLVQGIFSTLLQHHSSNASMQHLSSFLTVQDSHPYIAMGKTKVLTILVLDSLESLLLFMRYLSFTIATLARLSCLLISSEDVLSLFTKVLRKLKDGTTSILSPSIWNSLVSSVIITLVFLMFR